MSIKGLGWGGQKIQASPLLENVSPISTHPNGLGPLEWGRLGSPEPSLAWHPQVYPNPSGRLELQVTQKQEAMGGGDVTAFRSGRGVRQACIHKLALPLPAFLPLRSLFQLSKSQVLQ